MWPPIGLLAYKLRVEKGEEICRDNKNDQRQRTALRECMGRLGLFILEEKLYSRERLGRIFVCPNTKLGAIK